MALTPKVVFTVTQADRNTAARAGVLKVNGYAIKTPILWLGHSFKSSERIWKDADVELPGILANACHVLTKPTIAQAIYKKGLRSFLDYDGPIMMDSGGFLFQKASIMKIRPRDIAGIYHESQIDIGVTLDHPLNPSLSSSDNKKRWLRTLRNTEAMMSAVSSCAFMPVVHGYSISDLKIACRQVKEIAGDSGLIGIGSLVPLLKTSFLGNGIKYQRGNGNTGNHITFISDALTLVREEFPNSFLHVFGVGGVTTALSIFAMGADSVDSVAWRLKAAYGAIQLPGISDRFLSPRPNSPKPRRVINTKETHVLKCCKCPICFRYSRVGWRKRRLDNSFKSRSIHNAWVFTQEVHSFRKEIVKGEGYKFIIKHLSNSHRFSPLFLNQH